MKIVTVLGARPQFIKAIGVSLALASLRSGGGRAAPTEVVVHTGQHYDSDMSDIFFSELGLVRPTHQLGIGGGSHGQMTGRMLEAIEGVLIAERPDIVLVYGDTNSTLAGALAAAKLHIPIAHVEAGLRSFNRSMPEEINRVLTDHCSALLFCPTPVSVDNLRREGITNGVQLVGDVMLDVALRFGRHADERSRILERVGVRPQSYVLATVHRAENTDDPACLRKIVEALERLAARTDVVFPLHPRTAKALDAAGLRMGASVKVTPPLGFLDMLMLEKNALSIATDSGGVQKEAYFYGVPCVILRGETEWVELIEAGAARLAPPTSADIFGELEEACRQGKVPADRRIYGDGDAGRRIVETLTRQ